MVRLRVEEPPDDSGVLVPERLRVCVVEDWVDAATADRFRRLSDVDVAESLRATAWFRWKAARRAWAAANGVSRRQMRVLPARGPRFAAEE